MNFCRFYGWTPRQVDALTPDEYEAFMRAAVREQRIERRQARAAQRRGRR